MPGISQWNAAVDDLANGDLIGITDVSDPTQSVNGSSKKLTFLQLLSSMQKRLQNVPATSGTINLDCSVYHTFVITITGATTLELTNFEVGQTVALVITDGGTNMSWNTNFKWPDGDEPEFSSSGVDRLVLQKIAGSVIHGSLAGQAYA